MIDSNAAGQVPHRARCRGSRASRSAIRTRSPVNGPVWTSDSLSASRVLAQQFPAPPTRRDDVDRHAVVEGRAHGGDQPDRVARILECLAQRDLFRTDRRGTHIGHNVDTQNDAPSSEDERASDMVTSGGGERAEEIRHGFDSRVHSIGVLVASDHGSVVVYAWCHPDPPPGPAPDRPAAGYPVGRVAIRMRNSSASRWQG